MSLSLVPVILLTLSKRLISSVSAFSRCCQSFNCTCNLLYSPDICGSEGESGGGLWMGFFGLGLGLVGLLTPGDVPDR